MELSNRDKVIALLNSFNTGDPAPISYINPNQYTQHNLAVADGLEGFGALMKDAPEGGFKARIVRAFQDGDFVFTHTEYDFFGPKAGFDVFRFEEGLIVEHWDNLTEIQPPNPSGRTQFDGATRLIGPDKTEENKQLVGEFVRSILMNGEIARLTEFISTETYLQHNTAIADGLDGLGAALKQMAEQGLSMEYHQLHKVLGEGNFVLTMSEGRFAGEHVSFYDLFRVDEGKIVEHWDVIEPIPAPSDWKNQNGKF
jgi:predicted SnoaL-like aldol condensation-catalyzing enzyme